MDKHSVFPNSHSAYELCCAGWSAGNPLNITKEKADKALDNIWKVFLCIPGSQSISCTPQTP